ncbi:MAG: hypothetical protein KKF46_06730 [Nanoarchaeota archaeon]|nr:hypothetical protein [Nanoarchaeota archaeon]MBU1322024.1 hypothetical protein [Nanoarchaeota archaeon]MBU1598109.1 hypothetical protein [Nanoarchaeota archaeon]MBU2441762.1 hypothetical protein [Nanoarchaeota archaeon]
MAEEYEYEDIANEVLSDMTAFMDVENNFIKKKHELKERLLSLDYVIIHLDERIPSNNKSAHALTNEINDLLQAITGMIESFEQKEVHIEQKEEYILDHIKTDLAHKDWRAVRKDINLEKKEEEIIIRLQSHELSELHFLFKKIKITIEKGLPSVEKEIRHYYNELYKVANVYERFFRDLERKERLLYGRLKKFPEKQQIL